MTAVLVSTDPQTVIRTARRDHRCSCHLRRHGHTGPAYGAASDPDPARWCENVIRAGEQYPEYLGESPAYTSGKRYCPACRGDNLGDWVVEVDR